MTRSFDDGDIVKNYYGNMHREKYLTSQGDTGIVRNLNCLAITNSGGGTLPRPRGLVKPRPVAKIAANPQPTLQEKQSMSKTSDVTEVDMCKNNISSFSQNLQPAGQQMNSEKGGSQVNLITS